MSPASDRSDSGVDPRTRDSARKGHRVLASRIGARYRGQGRRNATGRLAVPLAVPHCRFRDRHHTRPAGGIACTRQARHLAARRDRRAGARTRRELCGIPHKRLRVIPALGGGAAGARPRASALPQVRLAVLERRLRVLESPPREALAAELLLDLIYAPATVAASIRSGMSQIMQACARVLEGSTRHLGGLMNPARCADRSPRGEQRR
jgi:hypothetical protein